MRLLLDICLSKRSSVSGRSVGGSLNRHASWLLSCSLALSMLQEDAKLVLDASESLS